MQKTREWRSDNESSLMSWTSSTILLAATVPKVVYAYASKTSRLPMSPSSWFSFTAALPNVDIADGGHTPPSVCLGSLRGLGFA